MATGLKTYIQQCLETAYQRYLDDLEATPEELLGSSPGGSARTPYDFTYEVVYVNLRLAKRMRGEDPGPAQMDTWLRAPVEFQVKSVAMAQLRESAQGVVEAWRAEPDDSLERVIPLPNGETSPLDLAALAYRHMSYHDAQLNYVQSIAGDGEVHWKRDD